MLTVELSLFSQHRSPDRFIRAFEACIFNLFYAVMRKQR